MVGEHELVPGLALGPVGAPARGAERRAREPGEGAHRLAAAEEALELAFGARNLAPERDPCPSARRALGCARPLRARGRQARPHRRATRRASRRARVGLVAPPAGGQCAAAARSRAARGAAPLPNPLPQRTNRRAPGVRGRGAATPWQGGSPPSPDPACHPLSLIWYPPAPARPARGAQPPSRSGGSRCCALGYSLLGVRRRRMFVDTIPCGRGR